MKKFIRIGLSALLFAGFISSCDDDESTPQPVAISFAESAATLDEGQTITGTLTFPAAPVAANVTISLTGNAVYGTDYTTSPAATSGQIVIAIAKGDTQKEISFSSIENDIYEGDKNLIATLSTDSDLLNVGFIPIYTIEIRENDPEPAPITLNSADIPIADGFSIQQGSFVLSSFPASLPEGENQSWNLSDLAIEAPVQIVPYLAFSDDTVPEANFSLGSFANNVITGEPANFTALYKFDATGFYAIGDRYTETTTITVLGGAAEITFNAGDFLYTSPRTWINLPATFGNSETVSFTKTQTFNVNYPAAGLNNTPAATVDSYENTTSVVGWGKMTLPGNANEYEVLMVKSTYQVTRNYTLGGAPAPATLLGALGLSDGEDISGEEITFYTTQHGRIAWYTYDTAGNVFRAHYRSDLPQ